MSLFTEEELQKIARAAIHEAMRKRAEDCVARMRLDDMTTMNSQLRTLVWEEISAYAETQRERFQVMFDDWLSTNGKSVIEQIGKGALEKALSDALRSVLNRK